MGILGYLKKNTVAKIVPLGDGKGKIFVCGMPKSGTTAIAKLLAHSLDVSVNSDPFNRLDELGVKYRGQLFAGDMTLEALWSENRAVFRGQLVKDPNFPLLLEPLYRLFPAASFVFLVRDPFENIRSLLNRVSLPGEITNLDSSNVSIGTTWLNLLNGTTPDMPGNNYIENLSWRWKKSAELLHQYRERAVIAKYDDFVLDKENYIYSLGAKLDRSCKKSVADLVDVQYQPKGKSVKDPCGFFSPDAIDTISRITQDASRKFGYA